MRRFLLLLATALLLASCEMGGGNPTPQAAAPTAVPPTATPVPTPTPTPQEIAARIGAATAASSSVHFTIALSGAPVYTDASKFLQINSIEGDLKRPDGVLAILKVGSSGNVIEIRTVSLASKQYLTNPITKEWLCLAPGDAFDPVVLFDPQKGVERLLQNEFEQVTLVGSEPIDGRPHYHLRGTIAGAPLLAISNNSLGLGPVAVDLWADAATLLASRIVLVDTQTNAQNPSTWSMTFGAYDQAVDVQVPPGTNCP